MSPTERVRDRIVYPAALIMAFCLNGAALAAVFFLREYRHATASQIGIFTALDWLGYGLSCHLLRPRLRRLPAVHVVAAGMAISAMWIHLLIWVRPMPVLMALSLAKGITMSLFWPVVMGWLTRGLEGAALNRAMGRFNFSWSVGVIVGPMAAGMICDRDATAAIVLCALGMTLGAAGVLVASWVKPVVCSQISGGGEAAEEATGTDNSTHLRWPAWIGLFMGFVTLGVILAAFPLAANERMGLSRSAVGLLMLVRSLTMTLGFFFLARAAFWHFRRWPMALSALALAGLFVAMVYTSSMAGLVAVFAGMGIFMAVVYNASLFHGAAGSIDRTGRMAVHESLLAAGWVAGSAVGGPMYQGFGPAVVWWATAALLVISAVCALIVGRADSPAES